MGMNILVDGQDVPVLRPNEIRLSNNECVKIMNCVDNAVKNVSLIMAFHALRLSKKFFSFIDEKSTNILKTYLDEEQEFEYLASAMDSILNIRQNRVTEEEEFSKLLRLKSNDFWTRPKSAEQEANSEDVDVDHCPVKKMSNSGIKFFVYSENARQMLLTNKFELIENFKKKRSSLSENIKSVLRGFRGAANEAKAYNVMKIRKNLPGQRPSNYTTLQESPRDLSEFYVPDATDLLPGEYAFSEAIAQLRKLIFVHLLTSPEEVEKQKIKLEELKEKTGLHKQQIDKLMFELEKAEQVRETEMASLNSTIHGLQYEIDAIQQYSIEAIKRLEKENSKETSAEIQNSEARVGKLQTQLDDAQKMLEDAKKDNLAREADERVVKFKKEAEIETFIAKFDSEMLSLYNEYERIDTEYTEEKKELGELEEKFKTLSEEYDIIMEKRRLEAERLRLEEEKRQALINAATTIQSFWRSFKTRKVYRGKKVRKGKSK